MGFTTKSKTNTIITSTSTNTSITDSWAMGFLFVFFPEEDEKKPSFPLSNLSTSTSSSISFKSITRSNSSHLLSKAQSTISICAMLIFITLLLFTLSTFEPTSRTANIKSQRNIPTTRKLVFPRALQGMGSLYRRGTRAMSDLIVAHVVESATENELIYFLRLLHRSGVTSKTDILFLFPRKLTSFDRVIAQENASFSKLLMIGYGYENNYTSSTFDPNMFVISSRKERESGETIWGRSKQKENLNVNVSTESTRLSYGSVLSFVVDELDPENSLSGFFSEYVPMSLRRWACYPMLLGRVRRNYKHIMIVDVKDHLVLGDSLGQLKSRTQETVMVTTLPTRKKNSEKKPVNSGFVLGGARGIRRLTNAMLNEIVRGVTQHKKRNSVSESTLFNQLVTNEYILKNVDLIVSGESTHELSSLTEFMNSKSGSSSFSISKFPIIRRGNSNLDISYVFKKYLCSSPLDSIAYSDC